jgi:hypothetical protein
MVILFSALGIGVSVGIIAFGGGFSSGANVFNPPDEGDVYIVGAQVTDGLAMGYRVDEAIGPQSVLKDADVSIGFTREGDSWRTAFDIGNGTQVQDFEIMLSEQLTKEGAVDEGVRPYLEPVESSVMAVRDMDYGNRDKYLVVGAPWNTIFYGATSTIVRVTAEEDISTPAGTFHTYVLSYTLNEKTSTIHVVDDLPFPVRAEVYDPNDQLSYKYELVSLSR